MCTCVPADSPEHQPAFTHGTVARGFPDSRCCHTCFWMIGWLKSKTRYLDIHSRLTQSTNLRASCWHACTFDMLPIHGPHCATRPAAAWPATFQLGAAMAFRHALCLTDCGAAHASLKQREICKCQHLRNSEGKLALSLYQRQYVVRGSAMQTLSVRPLPPTSTKYLHP